MDTRRHEVINYTVNKYGADKVAAIITEGREGAKVAIRDVGAVLDLPMKLIDKVAKLIPQAPGMTLDKALTTEIELKELYEKDATVKLLIDKSKKIEGLLRQTGVHAAGVIISDKPLTEYGSLVEVEGSDLPVFVGNMAAVEYFRLLKMDFLGLKTLTVLDDCKRLVKENYGIEIDLEKIDLNDKKVYEFIGTGNTNGAFQLESSGMQDFMMKLKPSSLEDIIIGISMYRPGPMDKIPYLLECKQDTSLINYPEDAKHLLAPILDVTYGTMVYQEQVMAIVQSLGGYTLGRADLVRRAMGKKKMEVMLYEEAIFTYGEGDCPICDGSGKKDNGDNCEVCKGSGKIPCKFKCKCEHDPNCPYCNGNGYILTDKNISVDGCVRKGISEESASKIFADMIEFAKYAFNKSHAAAYGLIGYQTAYMLHYYPKEYMTAYLNSIITNADKLKRYIGITKKMGIKIERPDIKKSEALFTTDGEVIYMGLTALKNVGKGLTQALENRGDKPYEDLQDLIKRGNLGKKELESLIKSGALDSFGIKRSQMLSVLEDLINSVRSDKKKNLDGQISLFDLNINDDEISKYSKVVFPKINEYKELELYKMEKEISGFYLSGHPLDLEEYKEFEFLSNITTVDDFDSACNKKRVKMVGIIQVSEDEKEGVRYSATGNRYATFTLEDKYSTIKCLAFKEACDNYASEYYDGNIVLLDGTLSVEVDEYINDEGELIQTKNVKIFVQKVKKVNELNKQRQVYIKVNDSSRKTLNKVQNIADKNPGNDILWVFDATTRQKLKYNKTVGTNDVFIKSLENEFGNLNVKVV